MNPEIFREMPSREIEEGKPKIPRLIKLKEGDKKFLEEQYRRTLRIEPSWLTVGNSAEMAATMKKMGIRVEVSENEWRKMIDVLKRQNDPWKIARISRYLSEINPYRFKDEFKLGEEEKRAFSKELRESFDKNKWEDFFAMADNVRIIAPEIVEKIKKERLDLEIIGDYLRGLLKRKTPVWVSEHRFKEKKNPLDYVEFVEIANSLENISPGALKQLGFSKRELSSVIKKVVKLVKEDKERKYGWVLLSRIRVSSELKEKIEKIP